MTVLGRCVDELEVDRLEVRSSGGGDNTLAQSDGSLSRSSHASLDDQEVFIHDTVVRESSDWSDPLLGEIGIGRCRHGVILLADAEHSLVDLSAVVVTLLTSTRHVELNTRWMPCTNASHLSQASVGLSR